jgi:cyclomaltodextrinase
MVGYLYSFKKKKNLTELLLFAIIIQFSNFVWSQAPRVPEWSKDAVWYQIFPERFWNGDKSNDPTSADIKEAWPFLEPAGWQVHPWTSDWYKLQPWEEKTGKGFYQNSAMRRYGGDLQGVLDRLDYLAELEVTAVYFNPLFESPSHHKYDATMYRHIDNNFGPNPEKDKTIWQEEDPADSATWQWTTADSLFLKLIKECHRRQIKVIIDGVFNHVGYTFWAFQDVLKNQEKSAYKDWFVIKSWDNQDTPQNEFDYEGWASIRDLPEIREDENGLVSGFADHVHLVLKRWMDPNGDGDPSDGIDGWRLDVAEKVNINFWRIFRKWVKELNPEAYLTGEIWWEDWSRNKMFNAAPWLQGDAFDGVMNYRFARAVKKFVIDQKEKINVQAFVDSLQNIARDYPDENFYALQNLIDSHDMERLASQIVNPDRWIDHGGNPAQDRQFDVRKPRGIEIDKQKLIAGLQMTLPGAPMIYYGDEAGMWGGDDPDCRKPMIWPELQYDPEVSHPYQLARPKDKVVFDQELFNWYKQLIEIRKAYNPLKTGKIEYFLIENKREILGFSRKAGNQKLFILVNNKSNKDEIELSREMLTDNKNEDLVTNLKIAISGENFKIRLKPYQILILEQKD